MDTNLDIVNARLPLVDGNMLYTLAIRDGKWESVQPQDSRVEKEGYASFDTPEAIGGRSYLNAEGKLILPGFIDAHMHMDKAFSLPQVGNESGKLMEAIINYSRHAASFTKQELMDRMLRTGLQAASFGTSVIRTHLDFNTQAGADVAMQTVEAALEVKQKLAPYVQLQLFPMLSYRVNSGATTDIALIKEAFAMGVNGIGGAPHLADHSEAGIDTIFELAEQFNCPIDLHADETDNPDKRTAAYIAEKTIEYGFQGRVAVDHICSLASMANEDAAAVIGRMAEAKLHVVTLPAVNLYLQGRGDEVAVRRGVTRIKELTAAGITVAAASDNIHDPFHPFGRGDLLQIALITGYAAHMGAPADLRQLLRMVTEIPAAVMGLQGYGIESGNKADFVVIDARSPEELFTMLPERRWIYRAGGWLRAAPPRTEWELPLLRGQWRSVCHVAFGTNY